MKPFQAKYRHLLTNVRIAEDAAKKSSKEEDLIAEGKVNQAKRALSDFISTIVFEKKKLG